MGLDSFSFFLLLTIGGGFLRIRTFPVSGLRSVCNLRGCGREEYYIFLEVVGVYVGVVIGSVGFIQDGVVVVGDIILIHEGVIVAIGFLQEGVVLGVVMQSYPTGRGRCGEYLTGCGRCGEYLSGCGHGVGRGPGEY